MITATDICAALSQLPGDIASEAISNMTTMDSGRILLTMVNGSQYERHNGEWYRICHEYTVRREKL
jgi:hypothetical protein